MPGDMIGMRVRDETSRLTTADVNRELGMRQEETRVVMEHGNAVSNLW